jgi:hypothetical protein
MSHNETTTFGNVRRNVISVAVVVAVATAVVMVEPLGRSSRFGQSGPAVRHENSERVIVTLETETSVPTPTHAPSAELSAAPPATPRASTPRRPPDESPLWWEEVARGNTSAYPPYLLPLRATKEDDATAELYRVKQKTLSPSDFAVWLSEYPGPLPGWLPGRAEPILCHGREFYSGHFSIPPQNIVAEVPNKTQDWATVVPGRKSTYVFKVEAEYRADLERSRFAITRRRYGWATNRNLEILAAGGVPFFCGVHTIPKIGTLASLPKIALEAVVNLPGVRARCDPHKLAAGLPLSVGEGYNETRYRLLAEKLLRYTQRYQHTEQHALYVLSASSLRQLPRKVLLLWASHYTIMLTGVLNGLRRLGVEVTDVPRRAEIYEGPGCDEARAQTYAKGWFFFCRTEESKNISRDNVEARILQREFDLIIISVTDTLTYHMKNPFTEIPHYEAILSSYPRRRVLTLNDADLIRPMTADVAHQMMHRDTVYFKRETHGCQENWAGGKRLV